MITFKSRGYLYENIIKQFGRATYNFCQCDYKLFDPFNPNLRPTQCYNCSAIFTIEVHNLHAVWKSPIKHWLMSFKSQFERDFCLDVLGKYAIAESPPHPVINNSIWD